ncbi:phosphoribosyltransferase family protein [Rhizobium leguminosarum]|uniref:phosphoribosyltransferase family protein n=1 Tax=Rhizobium leguminosarum TaxID=384 RepID=UPI001C92225B|nr:phosphoribosyltransferase family protein [Rhizobium leguminosarum]MBY2989334.1 adenine phosphoribosyltransferase [Rhizobium leguminosarum]
MTTSIFDIPALEELPNAIEAKAAAERLLDERKVTVPDFPAPGVRYLDFYRSYERYPAIREAVTECFRQRYGGGAVDAVAGIGGGGFGLGSCLALLLKVPFHPIRKASETTYNVFSVSTGTSYSKRELTLAMDIVEHGSRVVLVDDTIATGGTTKGAIDLLHRAGAIVVEVATVFELISCAGRKRIYPTPLFSVISRDEF